MSPSRPFVPTAVWAVMPFALKALLPFMAAETLVDLFLDRDDLPTAITFHESVTGPALVATVEGIVHSAPPLRRRALKARGIWPPDREAPTAIVLRGFFMGLELATKEVHFPPGAPTVPA